MGKVVLEQVTITPSTAHPAYPWLHTCDEPWCRWRVTSKTPEPLPHRCPWYGGTTRIAWSITVTLVEQMWHRLDSIMDELALLPKNTAEMDPEEYREHEIFEANLKGKARGVAEMIAIFMNPHFTDANEVAREAKRRADARARQDESYETAGLGQRRYEHPPSVTAEDAVKYKREPAPKPILSPDEITKMKRAYGSFPPDLLAKTFGITVEQVKQICEAPEGAPV